MADITESKSEPQISGVTPESLKEKLEQEIGATYVEVADLSGQ
jgi:stress-induced morphogen